VEGFDELDRLVDFAMLREAVADFRTLDLPPSMEQLRLTGDPDRTRDERRP